MGLEDITLPCSVCLKRWILYSLGWLASLMLEGFVIADDERAKTDFFEAKIRPVLIKHCYECHSANSTTIQAGLQLDFRDGIRIGGDSGPGVVPNVPEKSLVLEALRYETLQMPPQGKLSEDVIRDFEDWIRDGANDPRDNQPSATDTADQVWRANLSERSLWWSLQPPKDSPIPSINDSMWEREPIDRFIRAATLESRIPHARRASADILLRRLSFVLIGLPPSPEEIQVFQQRWRDDPEAAYSEAVDRLLVSPHFGERFARHWMDVMHYTDTYGYEWDIAAKGSWEYRDYLIRAFNNDIGYNQLIREQIAGDLLTEPRINRDDEINESLIGPMFFHFGERRHGSSIEFAGIHQEMVDSQIDAFSKTFLAMTIACARCHDHKLDAVSQRDYYALAGVFMTPRWTTRCIDTATKFDTAIDQLQRLRYEIRTKLGLAWKKELDTHPIDFVALAKQSSNDKSIDELGFPLVVAFREPLAAPLHNVRGIAENNTTSLDLEADGVTIVASGDEIPETDAYTITFSTRSSAISYLQLHALTDPSLGQGGPGRTPHGNFVLSHLKVQAKGLKEESWREVAIRSAHADYEQPGYPVSASLTPDATGWGIGLGGNVHRTATYHFSEPINMPEGTEWKVRLEFQLGDRHSLGRFRLDLGSEAFSSELTNQATLVERWNGLIQQWNQERQQRIAHNQSFTVLADFSSPAFPEGWVTDGIGMKNGWVEEGTPRIALDGDKILSELLPRGIHTHAFSSKLSGAIRLPEPERFTNPFVSAKVSGGSWAGYRHIPQNAFLNEGPAFFDPTTSTPWTTFTTSPLRYGVTRVLSEISTPDLNANFPPRTGVARMGAIILPNEDEGYDKGGWLSITRIVGHDQPGHPLDELEVYQSLFESTSPISSDSIRAIFHDWYRSALDRWITNAAQPADTRILNWLIQHGILSNQQEAFAEIAALVRRYREIEATIAHPRTANSMDERELRNVNYRLNVRGDVHHEGPEVQRDFLEVFAGQHRVGKSSGSGRLELATYLSSPENPQTARVYVNRVWQWIFGTGIVDTPSDFGKLGGLPSHPELLDWLTLQFQREGWSTKQLIRRLVLSETFRQSGDTTLEGKEIDPSNRRLHHYPTRRLEAEAVRDSLLAVAGRLDRSLFGRPIRPHRSAVDAQKRLFSGPMDGRGRRSIYLEMSVMQPPDFLVGFNLPDLKIPVGRRDVTNVPSQALILMNSPFVNDMSSFWAEQLVLDTSSTPEDRLSSMFRTALGRLPTEGESQRWLVALHDFSDGRQPILQDRDAWRRIAHAFFNTKEFLYYR